MKNVNDSIADFYQKQKEFGYLQSIKLMRDLNDDNHSNYYLNIILSSYPFYKKNQKLLLTFTGVKNIKIDNLEGLYKLLINIRDISGNQMEGINYRVKEEENDMFSFYCKKFEFQIIL